MGVQKLLIFVSSIRWQDFIDIAFNSYILFRLYALFRGTDAFRVLVGIAFLWILQRLAVSLGLILTSWMMEGIIAVAALIVIVVFRNEIRSVFRARNIWAILWGLPPETNENPCGNYYRKRLQPGEKAYRRLDSSARKRGSGRVCSARDSMGWPRIHGND